MTNPAATQLIADNLARLPHPDGTTMMFTNFQAFPGQPQEMQAQIKRTSHAIAESLINLLELNNLTITDKTEEPVTSTQPTKITLHCAICGNEILTTVMTADGKISIPPTVINPDCTTRHGAA